MTKYIFTLGTAVSAGDTSLLLDLVQEDKITNIQYDITNVISENLYVTTFSSIQSIPDFTTVTFFNNQDGVVVVELSNSTITNISAGEDIIFYSQPDTLKEIKLGFNKNIVPKIQQTQQLIDIVTGDTLVDEYGFPLVTDALVSVGELASSDKATSTVLGTESNVKVKEVFPEFSEVSRTLLGISKAEQQLGLFSDVSVLGIDNDTWESTRTTRSGEYGPWGIRRTANYGRRYYASLREVPEEQALLLGSFPTPYSYPWQPPNYRYNFAAFNKFKIFVELGNKLYDFFYENQQTYGTLYANFLDKTKVTIGEINIEDINGNPLQEKLKIN